MTLLAINPLIVYYHVYMAKMFRLPQVHVQYVKPVQTGYPQDSDSRLVVGLTWEDELKPCAEVQLND